MQPQTANEVAQVMMDMNSFSDEIIALRNQRRPVRIFYSETSAIDKNYYMTEQFDLYESLFFEGFPVGYATEKIIKKQDNNNWDVIVVYKTELVTDAEFDAIQSYLNQGGTVVIDNPTSLSKNEYGKVRNKVLKQGKGKLVLLDTDLTTIKIKDKVLEEISNALPEIVLDESNGSAYKGCTWRVVKNPKGGFLMNILNIGKNAASLEISMKNGQKANATDMLTGQVLGSKFELKSNGVLLLEVK